VTAGFIDLGTAENHLLFDLLEPKLNAPRAITAADTHYQDSAGSPSFRAALAPFLTRLWRAEVDADDLVVLSGTGVALETLAFALCEPGDGIVVPTPYFSGLDGELAGRSRARIIPASDVSAEALDEAIRSNQNVRAIALVSPNNPLGQVYDERTLRAVAEVAAAHDLHLIADEIYAGSVHTGEFVSTARAIPSDRLHITWGFAKDFGLSGYKVGVLHTRNPEVRQAVLAQSRLANASSDTQALLRDLLLDTGWLEQFQTEARSRLRTAYEQTTAALTAAGIPYLPAAAGLFLYLDLTAHARSFEAEAALTQRLRTEARLNLAPGAGFHSTTPGYYRLCFATDPTTVTTAIERLNKLL
jgi:1-aminocyclopropane-1-carboxylate synthase 1/2/6